MRKLLRTMSKFSLVIPVALAVLNFRAQALPATSGETLSGKRIVLADAMRGHAAILIVGFTKAGGDGCGAWVQAVRADPALEGITIYSMAMLEEAPGFVRGMIKGSMRKGASQTDQDHFVILTQDEKLWRGYFGVTNDKDPYVALIDANGEIRWQGHGAAKDLEPMLRSAKP